MIANPPNIDDWTGAIGLPIPSTQATVLTDNGNELPLGEIPKIVIVKADPALTEQDLLDHCRKHLTDHQLPKIVEFPSEPLPKTKLGKILRRQLRGSPAPAATAAVTSARPAVAQDS